MAVARVVNLSQEKLEKPVNPEEPKEEQEDQRNKIEIYNKLQIIHYK